MQDNIIRAMVTILDLYGEIAGLLYQHEESGQKVEIWLAGPAGEIESSGPPLIEILQDPSWNLAGMTTEGGEDGEGYTRELSFLLNPAPYLNIIEPHKFYTVNDLCKITNFDEAVIRAALANWGKFPQHNPSHGEVWAGSTILEPGIM